VPNWLDTQGKPFGLIYWRFVMPEKPVPAITARVVKFAEVGATTR